MKQNELFSYLYDFVSQLLDNSLLFDKIKQIVVFGSVARGDFTPESDLDIFIELKHKNTELIKNAIKSEQHKFETRAEKSWYLRGINLPIKIIVGSSEESRWKELQEEIKSYGKVIYGNLEENPTKLKNKLLISYDLTSLLQKHKMSFLRKIYGYSIKKNKKSYLFEGLIKELSGEKIGPNNLIIPVENWIKMKQIFEQFKIKYTIKQFYFK